MTLSQIATFVCTRLGKIDSDSVAACKEFIQRRHQMVFDLALWKDSIGLEQVPIQEAGSNPPVFQYGLILSGEVRMPIKIRFGDAFGRAQMPSEVMQISDMMQAETLLESGSPVNWTQEGTSGIPVFMPDGGGTLTFECFAADAGKKIHVSGYSNDEGNKTETITLAAGINTTVTGDWSKVFAIEKEATTSPVTMTHAGTETLMGPADLVFRYPVLRLSPMPNEATQRYPWALVFGKKELRQMSDDGSLPMLNGIDNLLIAYATGDMLERSRQYAKAQVKFQEAEGLLAVVKDREIHQSGHLAVITPCDNGAISRDDFGW